MSASAYAGMNPSELANIAGSQENHWWYRGMRAILRRVIARYVPGKATSRVLEAGCGTGFDCYWLERQYGWNIVPVDRERTAFEHACSLQLPSAVQADVRALPFREDSFDLVLSLDVLVHISRGEESKCLKEFFRVTKPGGIVLLRAAAFEILRSRHSEFIAEKQRFTSSRLTRTAIQSGFRILYCTYANSLLFPMAVTKFRVWEPLMRKPASSGIGQLPDWLNKLLYLPLAVEAKWIGAGFRLPLGQSIFLVGQKLAEPAA